MAVFLHSYNTYENLTSLTIMMSLVLNNWAQFYNLHLLSRHKTSSLGQWAMCWSAKVAVLVQFTQKFEIFLSVNWAVLLKAFSIIL